MSWCSNVKVGSRHQPRSGRRATPHTLRHAYATRLFEKKVDTRVVQAFLGHENIATTTIYTHLTEPTRASLRKLLDRIMSGFF